jgi:hypothetical protein
MRHFSLIVLLFALASCKGQDTINEYNFPQVDWTLRIPATSKFLDSAQFDTISRKAVNAINKTYDVDFSFKDIKSLFTIRQGQFNLLGSTINLFDTTLGMTWEQSYAASKEMVIQVINDQAPAVKIIDTLSSYQVIDGLRFEKLYLRTFYPDQNLTMNTYWLYRKQNEYDFSISISYTDDLIGKQFLDLIKDSRFSK